MATCWRKRHAEPGDRPDLYDRGGVFRDDDNVYASLIAKNVGPRYGLNTATVGHPDTIPVKSYNQVDLAGGYTFTYNGRKLLLRSIYTT